MNKLTLLLTAAILTACQTNHTTEAELSQLIEGNKVTLYAPANTDYTDTVLLLDSQGNKIARYVPIQEYNLVLFSMITFITILFSLGALTLFKDLLNEYNKEVNITSEE